MNKIFTLLAASILSLFLFSCEKNSHGGEKTGADENIEFFKLEFKGTTYDLVNLMASRTPNGHVFQGVVKNTNSLVTVLINTETSSATTNIPFGDQDEVGKSVVQFNIPQNEIYSTAGYDCHGRYTYSQGHAKLTAIGNVGGYVEGNFSGAAYYNQNNCPDHGSVKLENFKGSFKILRKL